MSHGFDGLPDITEAIYLLCDNDDVEVYFKLYLLLYADDTVKLAESQEQLQAALNSMYLYCQTWKLEVNPAKTKVVIFAKRKVKENPVFVYNGEQIVVVDDFVYLGVTFTHNASFTKHKNQVLEQGRKAMFSVLRKTKKNSIYQSICSCKCLIVWLYRFYCMGRKFMVMRNLTLLSHYFYNSIRFL